MSTGEFLCQMDKVSVAFTRGIGLIPFISQIFFVTKTNVTFLQHAVPKGLIGGLA